MNLDEIPNDLNGHLGSNPVNQTTFTSKAVERTIWRSPFLWSSLAFFIALLFIATAVYLRPVQQQPRRTDGTRRAASLITPSSRLTSVPSTPLVSPFPSVSVSTEGWKTYTNRTFGFEVKYPPSVGLVVNDKASENDIDFIPKKYLTPGRYEPPRLHLHVSEVDRSTDAWLRSGAGANLPKSFGEETLKEHPTIYYIAGSQKQLLATCGTYGDRSVLDMCNHIIMTLRFTR